MLCGSSIVWLGSGKTKLIVEMRSSKFLVELGLLAVGPSVQPKIKVCTIGVFNEQPEAPAFSWRPMGNTMGRYQLINDI